MSLHVFIFMWRSVTTQLDTILGQEQYAQIPMAAVGTVMKFFQIVIFIVIGMAAGCIPIVGFNMGAKLNHRVKQLFTRLLVAEACVGAVALLIVELFPNMLINISTDIFARTYRQLNDP